MHNCFHAGDILVPQNISMKKWACVACDQFSSQPEYWDSVSEFVGDSPSTFHLIVPEAYLNQNGIENRVEKIHNKMDQYLDQGIFRTYRRSYVYLERAMADGTIRHGLIGQVDLEEYDYTPGSGSRIRATEGTVKDRIPPRMRLLEHASLEFPHVLLLCDDRKNAIFSAAQSVLGEKLYDFDLMKDGGHITGWLIDGLGVSVVNAAISEYINAVTQILGEKDAMAFAVGDGNHSLASAKACWNKLKQNLTETEQMNHPGRYALVELENIHDSAIEFEPIHRLLTGIPISALRSSLEPFSAAEGYPVVIVASGNEETIMLNHNLSPLALSILQPVLDDLIREYGGNMDYIHGEDTIRTLAAQEGTIGLILPGIDKNALFKGVMQGGVLPRKTFSMGAAREKRYYLEGKRRK